MAPRSALTVGTVGCFLLFGSCARDPSLSDEDTPSGAGTQSGDDEAWDLPQDEQWPFDEVEAKRRQAGAASRLSVPVGYQLALADGVDLDLVLIPAGRFVMGFPGSDGNEPRDVAIARPFYVGKLETTWRQYMTFRQDDHLTNLELDAILDHERDRLDHPVQGMTWTACRGYCRAASKALGCTIRLPTEAEWEYACRAGTTKKFIWDDVLRVGDANASCLESVDGKLRPVQRGGQCRANAWGLYDMIGNVDEWVYDRYKTDEAVRTVRDSSRGYEGLAERRPELRTSSGPYDGFRVVVEIGQHLVSRLREPEIAGEPDHMGQPSEN